MPPEAAVASRSAVMTPEYDSAARPSRPIEELRDVTSNGQLLLALIARNIKVRYKRSVFGVFWTMAQPATMLVVLVTIFGHTFAPRPAAYAIYLAPGLILWHFFAQTTSSIIGEVAAAWRCGGVCGCRRLLSQSRQRAAVC